MSDLLTTDQQAARCHGASRACPEVEVYPAKAAELGGGLQIRRALPVRGKRMIGAWCFLDHFGPLSFDPSHKAMDVAAHPHIGLQTVTWLLQGEVLHKDSLGYEQVIRPGQLNIMTAGHGISHSEETPQENSGTMHGVQFWIALPDADRNVAPAFAHHPALPSVTRDGMTVQVFVGEAMGQRSPAVIYSPMVGMDVALHEGGVHELSLNPDFEHALVVLEGSFRAGQTPCEVGALYDLGIGRDMVDLTSDGPARLVLVGGAPFGETIAMWWNFVARTTEELQTARDEWEGGARFGDVVAYKGGRLGAPRLNYRVK